MPLQTQRAHTRRDSSARQTPSGLGMTKAARTGTDRELPPVTFRIGLWMAASSQIERIDG